jgi:nucleoid DNA-binding protein
MTIHFDEAVEAIKSELKKSGEVRVSGLGTFVVKEMKARNARNPKTGEAIVVPAHKKLAFRAGKEMKESL